jgi:hypothetical protein
VTTFDRRYPLGRVVEHDPRSRAYAVPRLADLGQDEPLRSTGWWHYGPVLDQGDGACVAFTGGDLLNSRPLRGTRSPTTLWNADRCLDLYADVTALDDYPGTWRRDGTGQDTGSSALGLYRALKARGEVTRIEWAFGLRHALEALMRGPVAFGIPWRSDMFTPDAEGRIRYSGDVVGGHELAGFRLQVRLERVWLLNHWGPDWGRNGWCWMTWDDLGQALAEQGDAAQLIR